VRKPGTRPHIVVTELFLLVEHALARSDKRRSDIIRPPGCGPTALSSLAIRRAAGHTTRHRDDQVEADRMAHRFRQPMGSNKPSSSTVTGDPGGALV